jgi:hypothetical protein
MQLPLLPAISAKRRHRSDEYAGHEMAAIVAKPFFQRFELLFFCLISIHVRSTSLNFILQTMLF